VPVVVVTHAASSPTRDLPLYRHLIELLPTLGVAAFVYDRRGSGASGGELAASDYPTLADDAIAAQRMLEKLPAVDPRRIGFWGLSQGGWIAVLAGARSASTAFVISVSAPMTTPDAQMNFAVANLLSVEGYSHADVEQAVGARRAVDAYLRGELDRASAQKALDAARARPWFDRVYMGAELPSDPAQSRWLKEMRHDPLARWPRSRPDTRRLRRGRSVGAGAAFPSSVWPGRRPGTRTWRRW
jgi:alpha/beta superfamily hydrolase